MNGETAFATRASACAGGRSHIFDCECVAEVVCCWDRGGSMRGGGEGEEEKGVEGVEGVEGR